MTESGPLLRLDAVSMVFGGLHAVRRVSFEVPKGAMIVKVTEVHGFDEKKFEEEKKEFAERMKDEKSREKMQEILEGLRDKLSLNLELMKEIFPDEGAAA